MTKENDLGAQPLEQIMIRLQVENSDLVKASKEQLTFKMVQKARKGRRLTLRIQKKILNALQVVKPEETWTLPTLFNY